MHSQFAEVSSIGQVPQEWVVPPKLTWAHHLLLVSWSQASIEPFAGWTLEVSLPGTKMHVIYFLAGLEHKCSINAQ